MLTTKICFIQRIQSTCFDANSGVYLLVEIMFEAIDLIRFRGPVFHILDASVSRLTVMAEGQFMMTVNSFVSAGLFMQL